MPKLPSIKPREAIAAFERDGFVHARTSGSHATYKKEGHRFILTIPISSGTLKSGTLRSLIRSAGLTVEEFIDLLG